MRRSLRGRLALLVVLAGAGVAQAWEISLQLVSETSIRGSTESSEASTRADAEDRREKRADEQRRKRLEGSGAISGSQCSRDDQCQGRCRDRRCEDLPVPAPAHECEVDQTCGDGRICRDFACVGADPVVMPPLPCSGDEQCQPGQACTNGQCLSLPPSPPSSSLQRRGTELYLRDRAVQLRQDVALGEGPVISTLASVRGLSPGALGRTMRAHRAELLALMSDGSDETWPGRFLQRVDGLTETPPRSVRAESRTPRNPLDRMLTGPLDSARGERGGALAPQ